MVAKVAVGTSKDDLQASREFWAKHLPADVPYDLMPTDVDKTKVVGRVTCPSCKSELSLAMPKYAALRLRGKAHKCVMCTAELRTSTFRRSLTIVMNASIARIACPQVHPKTRQLIPKHAANIADLEKLFDRAEWAKYGGTLPLAASSLILPGNRRRFFLVMHWHKDFMAGPWAMDMIRAVRRQRRFSAKMADLMQSGMAAVYLFHTEALMQYPKFLSMAVAHLEASLQGTFQLLGYILYHDD
ncbi:hypothetical protein AMAG_16365 [Allomyces macrogynus ATCC 38327]|uniref:Uncharacterized protein n=1 Tax=Allomyces macrogynus (strain ATCC 38327) TaxID=578462 RepID=A0A0L0TB11_ALLM3|nr:hypothetical protein AMAG_16365 [Allomyces macrogynus ATCC 38327]|eukprot:KNE71942.1 hypothetical protein AMAG_16365 [Allomyces macrogynus ATCC 38327]